MIVFRSFQVFLILMISFTAVTQHRSFITVRVGGKATLPCEGIKDYQDKCHSTTWIFSDLTNRPSVTLFEYGKIHREAVSKSDRLRVTEKCSLVIKKVTYEDVGHYTCRQFDESGQKVTDFQVDLIVIKRDNVATPPAPTTKLPTTTKAITRPTTTKTIIKISTKATFGPPPTTTKRSTTPIKATTSPPPTTTDSAAVETSLNSGLNVVVIPVAVVLAALLIIVVAVIRWKRAKGNHTQLEDNNADPPDGVSYASIRYKKKTKSKAPVQGEDDTVTYSTLNTSSTSVGASTDPKNLYA